MGDQLSVEAGRHRGHEVWGLISELRKGASIDKVDYFVEAGLPAFTEGLTIDDAGARAFLVIDGDEKDCAPDAQPAKQMTLGLE